MDVTKSWTETEMDGQRGPDDYPSVIKTRCKVCSEFRARLKNVRTWNLYATGILALYQFKSC